MTLRICSDKWALLTEREAVSRAFKMGIPEDNIADIVWANWLAEVITAPDEAEIRYFFERLAAAFPLAEYGLQAAGDDPKRLCRLIGHLFKNTTCA